MASFKQRYDNQQKKKAISLLQSFLDRIKKGEFIVEVMGTWQGVEGKHNLKIVVKEKES